MAEYHNECVERIILSHAGASDEVLSAIQSWITHSKYHVLGITI